MKTLISIGFLALCACGSSPEDLCSEPPCTITPTHPWLNVDDGRDYAHAHDRVGAQAIDQDAGQEASTVPLAVCRVSTVPGVAEDVFCDPAGVSAQWIYWPPPSTPPSGGVPCTAQAVLPQDGDLCYVSTTALYGVVHHIP